MIEDKYTLTVNYITGDQEKFEVTPKEINESLLGTKIRDALATNMLIIGLEEGTLTIPFTSIRNFEFNPALPKLPPDAIKQARRIS